ncbi:HAD hydrolase-like protein [Cytophagaceae bacterium YF14B1]|uniref:HAD hydrolase-like protein n=1 Tax=Xanthocytophaga flava TaxID=3048013 RepID=A0AAE3UA55_9BACT|nr:HAD hydrolase-like protein [Xanthocytophaga flavus]MDJ1484367.1 HAD hydrolase-like protein [Xanthocytophaga flavus]
MLPQLIVFDLAGTTVDGADKVPHFLQKALADYNVAIPFADANELMGLPKPVAIRQLLERHTSPALITEELIDQIHQRFVEDMTDYYQNSPDVKEKEGASETFALLKKHNVKVVVDTGFDRQITDAILERLLWRVKNLIDNSVTSDEVENGRPFPDMIFRAMELTSVHDSKQVAKVGDTASDMQQGDSAGCGWVIGVTTGAYTAEELEQEPHTHLIHTLADLQHIFSLS